MSISQQDCILGCRKLHEQWQQHDRAGSWADVSVLRDLGREWLRITCTIKSVSRRDDGEASSELVADDELFDEEDEEALQSPLTQPMHTQPKHTQVVYDILHSPSYQVPVLYITFKDLPSTARGLPPPEQVYKTLIPASYRPQIGSFGPMGALSMTDHPITSTPAYFVHPCRTAEAMKAVTAGNVGRPEEYLLQWIGIIGQSVGLSVSLKLARSIASSESVAENA